MSLRPFDRLILHSGVVRTMDDRDSLADAIGFANGRVTATGTLASVRSATGNAEERSLDGAAVYPGFVDAHHHFSFAATFAGFAEIRSPPARMLSDILDTVRREAARTPEGQWIVLTGFDEGMLQEHRKPTRADIDAVAPRHPVLLIHFTYHEGVLNSLGLQRAGFLDNQSDPTGGWLGRSRRGHLDGGVFERCFGLAESAARAGILATHRDGWFGRANAYQERVLAAGITHICDAAVPPSLEALYRAWQQRGELHVGVTMMPIGEAMLADPSDRLDGPVSGPVDGRLSMGPLKLFLDGGVHCAMCFSLRDAIAQFATLVGKMLRAPSQVPWRLALQQRSHIHRDGTVRTGVQYYDDAALTRIVRDASDRGFGIAMHAAGNGAIRQALTVLDSMPRALLAPRIDHFFFAEHETTRRAANEGIAAVVQPLQLIETGDWILSTGLPRGLTYHGYRQMLDAGMTLVGSSDAPVVSFDVLRALVTATQRRVRSGACCGPEERVSIRDGLRMYTRNAARMLGLEGEIGQLIPGARADAVMLSHDPLAVPIDQLDQICVRGTFAGRVEYVPD